MARFAQTAPDLAFSTRSKTCDRKQGLGKMLRRPVGYRNVLQLPNKVGGEGVKDGALLALTKRPTPNSSRFKFQQGLKAVYRPLKEASIDDFLKITPSTAASAVDGWRGSRASRDFKTPWLTPIINDLQTYLRLSCDGARRSEHQNAVFRPTSLNP